MERKPEVRIEGQIIRLLMLSDVCLVHLQQGETPESETGEKEMVAVSGQYMGDKRTRKQRISQRIRLHARQFGSWIYLMLVAEPDKDSNRKKKQL